MARKALAFPAPALPAFAPPVLALPDAALAEAVAVAAGHLREGRHCAAAAAVLPVLLLRDADGDMACGIAAALLQHSGPVPPAPPPEDKMAELVSRLVGLLQQQEAQIASLLDLVDAR